LEIEIGVQQLLSLRASKRKNRETPFPHDTESLIVAENLYQPKATRLEAPLQLIAACLSPVRWSAGLIWRRLVGHKRIVGKLTEKRHQC